MTGSWGGHHGGRKIFFRSRGHAKGNISAHSHPQTLTHTLTSKRWTNNIVIALLVVETNVCCQAVSDMVAGGCLGTVTFSQDIDLAELLVEV